MTIKKMFIQNHIQIFHIRTLKDGIEKKLSSNYAKTQWFFQEDALFQTGRSELFIGRNVRNMEDAHAPGMLFFKMDEKYLKVSWKNRTE